MFRLKISCQKALDVYGFHDSGAYMELVRCTRAGDTRRLTGAPRDCVRIDRLACIVHRTPRAPSVIGSGPSLGRGRDHAARYMYI